MGGYTYDGRTDDNSFAAGKIAVSLFRELTDNLYVFGQLTTAIADEGDEEPATEIEIDNLLVSFTPQGASNLNLTFGTLDAPVGFERDDEVLLFTPSTSFNFELARPAKLTGLFGTWTPEPEGGPHRASWRTAGTRRSTPITARPSAPGSACSRRSARASA